MCTISHPYMPFSKNVIFKIHLIPNIILTVIDFKRYKFKCSIFLQRVQSFYIYINNTEQSLQCQYIPISLFE